jgi:hypothetical protein|tara:strand:- start:2239 stop:2460 length:222 start_codon:yes stop_codon:yes gene_type:complete
MKEKMKKVTITSDNITPKQWSVLLIELNMIKEQWKSYAKLNIHTSGFNKVVAWGKRRYDTRENKRSSKFMGKN